MFRRNLRIVVANRMPVPGAHHDVKILVGKQSQVNESDGLARKMQAQTRAAPG